MEKCFTCNCDLTTFYTSFYKGKRIKLCDPCYEDSIRNYVRAPIDDRELEDGLESHYKARVTLIIESKKRLKQCMPEACVKPGQDVLSSQKSSQLEQKSTSTMMERKPKQQ